jgi:hypothetical protein
MDKRIRLRQQDDDVQSLHFSASLTKLAGDPRVHNAVTEAGAERVMTNPDRASLSFRPPLEEEKLRSLGETLLQMATPYDSGAGNFIHFIDARHEPEQYWQSV